MPIFVPIKNKTVSILLLVLILNLTMIVTFNLFQREKLEERVEQLEQRMKER